MVVLKAESADEWEDVVSNCFVPLRTSAFSAGFHGQMEHVRLDERVSVSVVTTDGTIAERTPRLAAHSENDDLHISLQASSRGLVSQGGHRVPVGPGSVSTYATDSPYFLDYSAPEQRQVIIQVSRSALKLPMSMVAESCARLAVPQSDAARVLFSYVALLQERSAAGQLTDPEEAAEITKDLSSTMIQGSFGHGRVVPRSPGGMMFTIRDFITANVATLRVDDIAHEFYMSRRSLYNLFGRTGTSPADYLRNVKLGNAAAMLTDHKYATWSVRRIGSECGFPDATSFNRAFRREFSCTPLEWRRSSPEFQHGESQVA
ncbi:AraC family transcriptional regulator [Lysinimonas soli]|uniref:AraC family transcriptional regulator n=1 Tax=Lysinimonas soli TaxID=1074233 RepID=A0ABW0NRE6_9MICO